jgi:hypothetical protein
LGCSAIDVVVGVMSNLTFLWCASIKIVFNMSHCTPLLLILLWSPGEREGVNPRRVVRNFFFLIFVVLTLCFGAISPLHVHIRVNNA